MKVSSKIAIIHDVFIAPRGAERVALALLHMFPTADLFTAFVTDEMREVVALATRGRITISPFNNVPFAQLNPDLYKPLLYNWWHSLNLSKYDIVISSSHSFSAKSVHTSPKQLHISYIHTPPRYLWEEFHETQWISRVPFRRILSSVIQSLRTQDILDAQGPTVLVASSRIVQKCIRQYYHRSSVVIYPPVTIPLRIENKRPQYYLCLSRFVRQKGIDIAIRACNILQRPLVVAGAGPEEQALRKIAGPTVSFSGWVSDEQKEGVYAGAIALLWPSYREDFGLTPVEAMAYGVPVIGTNDGGLKETVVSGKTGILFSEHTPAGLVRAMQRFERQKFSSQVCRTRAKLYSLRVFEANMKTLIMSRM